MQQVERFIHIRTMGMSKGGATVRVVGDLDDVGSVSVQAAFCSKKDAFSRKTGRDTTFKAPIQVMPLRNLPRALAMVRAKAEKATKTYCFPEDFSYMLKYFLPKV
jgi:hypothetical protein